MLRAYRQRIYPTVEQATMINKHLGCSRWVYNWALAKKIQAYQTEKKHLSRFDIQKELPVIKKQGETLWLSEVAAQPLQASLENLDKAFTAFFKTGAGFPNFKSKKNNRQSYSYPQGVKVNQETGVSYLPKVGNVKIVFTRPIKGLIKTVTVSRTPTGKYFISILCETGEAIPKKKAVDIKTAVGVDVGLKSLAILSDGTIIDNPKRLRNSMKRLKCLQRRASRKVKGSNNRKKANKRVAVLHEKITNQRADFLHKVSDAITKQYDTICTETLNVSGMMANHKLAGAIADVGWGTLFQYINYKSEWRGKNRLQVGRFEPSSKIHNKCGYYYNDLTLADRTWFCPSCKEEVNRDGNAALNIRDWCFHPKNNTGAGCSGEHGDLLPLGRGMNHENVNNINR